MKQRGMLCSVSVQKGIVTLDKATLLLDTTLLLAASTSGSGRTQAQHQSFLGINLIDIVSGKIAIGHVNTIDISLIDDV